MIIKIQFLDYWHLSSGLSAGAKGDSTVVKDENSLPYIPAKTLKGLARQMAELNENKNFLKECFGDKDNQSKVYFSNASIDDKTKNQIIKAKLQNNLYIDDKTKNQIIKAKLQNNLYDEISTTKIDKNGIAKTGSLREIEVVVPLSLYAKVENIPSEYVQDMKQALKSIKQMGLNRNRGLGRCEISILGEKNA